MPFLVKAFLFFFCKIYQHVKQQAQLGLRSEATPTVNNRSFNQLINQPINHLINQSVNHPSIDRSFKNASKRQAIAVNSHSVSPAIRLRVHQPITHLNNG